MRARVGLGDDQRAMAVALAAAAFMDDPLYAWLVPGASRRRRVLVALMRRALAGCSLDFAGGGPDDSDGPDDPRDPDVPLVSAILACHDPARPPSGGGGLGLGALPLLLAPRRALIGLGLLRKLRRLRGDAPHVHVEILAVADHARGRGFARRLLDPLLASADERALPVHLETTNPANVALYQRFGFAVSDELTGAHPPAWVMRRASASLDGGHG